MKRRKLLFGAMGAVLVSVAFCASPRELEHPDGRELVGRSAPPLQLKQWLKSQPLEMSGLRGKVVLLRWWTQGCPLCEATAPALRKLQHEYEERGLQVIGIYHPKPPGDWDLRKVEDALKAKGFTFPVALDGDWTALKRWWLTEERDYTSVSFLVDRKGTVRYVHPGGEFHEGTKGAFASHETCLRDFRFIETEIARLLEE